MLIFALHVDFLKVYFAIYIKVSDKNRKYSVYNKLLLWKNHRQISRL